MDKIHPILEIEKKYAVETIKVNGMFFWPFLRNYIGSQIHFNKNRQVKISTSNIKMLIKSLPIGLLNLFKKTEYLFMTSSDQRRLIDGFYVDRMDFAIDLLITSKTELIELPNPKHYKRDLIKTKNFSSKIFYHLVERIISKFIVLKFENENIIKEIFSDYKLEINYNFLAKNLLSQYYFFKFILKKKETKTFLLTTAYINSARVKAAKDLGIKVIEFQHGIINKNHYGYNLIKEIDNNYYPDMLLTFGKNEMKVFDDENYYIEQDNVHALGSFYIDYLLNKKNGANKKIELLRTKYNQIICFSAQDAMDELWIPFFIEITEKDSNNAYIIMPRHKKESYYRQFGLNENVFFISELNTYEIIAQADVHSTINSTTAIESLSLGTPNILLNINNLAKKYLGNSLKNFTYFADNADSYINILNSLEKINKIEIIESNNKNIVSAFAKNIEYVISEIEN